MAATPSAKTIMLVSHNPVPSSRVEPEVSEQALKENNGTEREDRRQDTEADTHNGAVNGREYTSFHH
jgi:hypothetical protein